MINFYKIDDLKNYFNNQKKNEFLNVAFKIYPDKFINFLDKEQKMYSLLKVETYKQQIEEVLLKLNKNTDTRQAILRFSIEGDFPNCMLDIQFQIKENKIITTVYQRSLDVLTKVQQDIEIVKLIVEKFCKNLNLNFEKSKIIFFVGNAHYFEIDGELNSLNSKIKSCESCKLHFLQENIFNYQKGFGKLCGLKSNDAKKIDYLFVGINPSIKREQHLIKTFDVSENHKNYGFIKILKELEIYNSSYITNLVKCSSEKNEIIEDISIESCKNYLLNEILILKPKKRANCP